MQLIIIRNTKLYHCKNVSKMKVEENFYKSDFSIRQQDRMR